MMKRITIPGLLAALLTLGLLQGCYPDKIDYVDEYDVAATRYDETADFSGFATFHVLDTIVHLTDNEEDDSNFTRDYDEFILELIRQNMRDLGYQEVESPDSTNSPDLAIFVEALSSEYYSYWYGYWDWYPWYSWYPGYPGYPWYPSYPWYPGGGYYSSYTTGTLMIEMADMETFDPETEPKVDFVWTGFVDGLLVGNKSNAKSRLQKQINQLFEQSPYLQQ
jgi:hypothetical protein